MRAEGEQGIYEKVRIYGKILLKTAGGGMHTQHTPHPPGCIITKNGLKFKKDALN